MAQFINAKESIVQDAINGLVAASGGALSRLDGFPFIRVVLRSDWDKSKVAIVSGGGSGHEPAHAGFVGKGMLTAAVCGDVFASPSVDAVLAGIVAVTGPAGCLLIVKNYTGDRLNFGLAAARARELGLNVTMIIVQDDISLRDQPRPRGVAGTLFVHKIAGATAEAGGDLASVTQAAERAAHGTKSVGMSLSSCTVPGGARDERIPLGKAELGLGIHGEPGAEQIPFANARQAMAEICDKLAPHVGSQPHVVLMNNLGGATALEMSILSDTLRETQIGPLLTHIVGPAPLMTALDMHGFSLSLYPLGGTDADLLEAPTGAPAWPKMRPFAVPSTVPMPRANAPEAPPATWNAHHAAIITTCCEALVAAEPVLNMLDTESGDGDTGTTAATAARAMLARLDALPLDDPSLLFTAIGHELTRTMGGSSGVLFAIFFSAAGEAAAEGVPLVAALKKGLDRMQEVGGAAPGDRTMIDALAPALKSLPSGLAEAATTAREGANATARMAKAHAGRASYVRREKLLGHNDPGAEAVAKVFAALATNLTEKV